MYDRRKIVCTEYEIRIMRQKMVSHFLALAQLLQIEHEHETLYTESKIWSQLCITCFKLSLKLEELINCVAKYNLIIRNVRCD